MNEPLLVSVREAAGLLGVGRDFLYQAAHDGRIRVLRVGRKILVPRNELTGFIEREAEEVNGGAGHAVDGKGPGVGSESDPGAAVLPNT